MQGAITIHVPSGRLAVVGESIGEMGRAVDRRDWEARAHDVNGRRTMIASIPCSGRVLP